MTHKDLYEYIRQEIINELTTVTKNTSTSEIPNISKAENIPSSTVDKAIKTAKNTGQDVNIAEMSPRPRSIIKKGDNFDEAVELYGDNTIEGQMLKIIGEAGEEGISQDPLAQKLGVNATSLNPRINEFISAGALTKPSIQTAPSEEPEDEDFDEEEFIEKDEEETEPEFDEKGEEEVEPEFDEKAAAEVEKEKGEEINKEETEKINKAREILIKKRDKILAADENDDEATYRKEIDLLKAYIKNNKDIIKKGKLTSLISDLINVK